MSICKKSLCCSWPRQLGKKRCNCNHGRKSSKWFGGAPKFCPKNELKVAWQINRFFCPTWGDLKKKKRSSLTLRRFLCPALGIFYLATCPNDMKLPKILTQYCPKNMKSPKILTQNRPKFIKLSKILPEIWTPYTNRGSQCPPGPPPPTTMIAITKKSPNVFYPDAFCIRQNFKRWDF